MFKCCRLSCVWIFERVLKTLTFPQNHCILKSLWLWWCHCLLLCGLLLLLFFELERTRKSAFFVSRGVLEWFCEEHKHTRRSGIDMRDMMICRRKDVLYVVCLCLSYAREMYIAISFPIFSVYTRKAFHLADMPSPSALSFSSHLTKWSYLVSLLLPLWELCLLRTFIRKDSRSLSKQWGRRERNVVLGPSFSLFPLRLFVSKTNVPTLSTSSLCTNSYQLSSPLYP